MVKGLEVCVEWERSIGVGMGSGLASEVAGTTDGVGNPPLSTTGVVTMGVVTGVVTGAVTTGVAVTGVVATTGVTATGVATATG